MRGNAWQGRVHPNKSGPEALICNQTRRVDSSTLLNQTKATPKTIDSHFVYPRLSKAALRSKAKRGATPPCFRPWLGASGELLLACWVRACQTQVAVGSLGTYLTLLATPSRNLRPRTPCGEPVKLLSSAAALVPLSIVVPHSKRGRTVINRRSY